ncbi:hypothetical protein BJA5080_03613 [Bradyrhizobium diazoefficiens SEMIA 5080]|uniref:Transposase n=1 Tax=Bradyrhizobium diazoefficiens SEMIA 5080 TaxID=754504 RepID=A0A837CCF5_9BRAD|nr:hypothetical protein BJA5080_03613 [Bradyrhizobium diazoefficiens SEMIA 5080]
MLRNPTSPRKRGEVNKHRLLRRLLVPAHRALALQRAPGAALGETVDHLADETARLLRCGCGRGPAGRRRNLLKRERWHRVSPRR